MRNKPVPADSFSEAQRRFYEKIATRSSDGQVLRVVDDHGTLMGPFNPMLYSPLIGQAAQQLGIALRETCLPLKVREVTILMLAQRWQSQFEWYAHERIARHAGLSDSTIELVKRGETPNLEGDNELALAYEFVATLLDERRVGDELFSKAKRRWGRAGILDICCLIGHYTQISAILNIFEVDVPDGTALPFEASEDRQKFSSKKPTG